jgi:hypothetical protein
MLTAHNFSSRFLGCCCCSKLLIFHRWAECGKTFSFFIFRVTSDDVTSNTTLSKYLPTHGCDVNVNCFINYFFRFFHSLSLSVIFFSMNPAWRDCCSSLVSELCRQAIYLFPLSFVCVKSYENSFCFVVVGKETKFCKFSLRAFDLVYKLKCGFWDGFELEGIYRTAVLWIFRDDVFILLELLKEGGDRIRRSCCAPKKVLL